MSRPICAVCGRRLSDRADEFYTLAPFDLLYTGMAVKQFRVDEYSPGPHADRGDVIAAGRPICWYHVRVLAYNLFRDLIRYNPDGPPPLVQANRFGQAQTPTR
jgi:hypothetical protein